MGQTEIHVGKLIEQGQNMTTFKEKIKFIPCYEKMIEEGFIEPENKWIDEYINYIYLKDKLYKIEDKKYEEDIFEAVQHRDCIEYVVSFYNGSCGLGEALEDAIEKMEK